MSRLAPGSELDGFAIGALLHSGGMADLYHVTYASGRADPGFTSYQCVPLPSRCTASGSTPPSCTFCFPSGPPGGTCDDGPSGELTVTLLAP